MDAKFTKLSVGDFGTFKRVTSTPDAEDNALVTVRFGLGRVKSTVLIHRKFLPAWYRCKEGYMTYHRIGWIELNLPDKEVKNKLNHLII